MRCTILLTGFAQTRASCATVTRTESCRCATLTWRTISFRERHGDSIAHSSCCTGRVHRSKDDDQVSSRSGLFPRMIWEAHVGTGCDRRFPGNAQASGVQTEGARTVLVLESGDAGLLCYEFRGDLLPLLPAECTNAPDEIFLVETCADLWWVWLIKRGGSHWPDTGMPELNRSYYDPDASPLPSIPEWLAGIPQRMRAALQLDDMYTPFLPGWAPATFEKDELEG